MNKFIFLSRARSLHLACAAARQGPVESGGMPPVQRGKLGGHRRTAAGWSHGRKTGWHGARVPPGFTSRDKTSRAS